VLLLFALSPFIEDIEDISYDYFSHNYLKQMKNPEITAKTVFYRIALITRRSEVQIFPPLPRILSG